MEALRAKKNLSSKKTQQNGGANQHIAFSKWMTSLICVHVLHICIYNYKQTMKHKKILYLLLLLAVTSKNWQSPKFFLETTFPSSFAPPPKWHLPHLFVASKLRIRRGDWRSHKSSLRTGTRGTWPRRKVPLLEILSWLWLQKLRGSFR